MWKRRVWKKKIPCMWWKKKELQRPERPKRLKYFLSLLKAATFRVSAALFFLIPGVAAFFAGYLFQPGPLLQTGQLRPESALALLTFLLSLLPPVLILTSSTLLKALEEDVKAQKRLAASVSFVAISFPGSWLAGVIFSSIQGKSPGEWILESIAALLYALFLIFPYRASASHLVGILLDAAREGGLFEDTTQATPQEKA